MDDGWTYLRLSRPGAPDWAKLWKQKARMERGSRIIYDKLFGESFGHVFDLLEALGCNDICRPYQDMPAHIAGRMPAQSELVRDALEKIRGLRNAARLWKAEAKRNGPCPDAYVSLLSAELRHKNAQLIALVPVERRVKELEEALKYEAGDRDRLRMERDTLRDEAMTLRAELAGVRDALAALDDAMGDNWFEAKAGDTSALRDAKDRSRRAPGGGT
jgi:Arc/MetJ-type ribon-helix-helix transcriptional regulator